MTNEHEMKIEAIATCYLQRREFGLSHEEIESDIYRTANDGEETFDSAQIAAGIARGQKYFASSARAK